jgi:hypothetical protein
MDNDFADKAQKIAFTIISISVIGLFTIPLFPWFGIEHDVYNWDTDEEIRVTDYGAGHSGYLHIFADMPSVPDEVENLDRDITVISICFWLSLILGVCALGGVALYRTGTYEAMAHALLIIGAFVIVLSLLAMIFHFAFFIDLGALEDEVGEGNEVHYGYNFFPLIFIILLFITSLLYLIRIVPFSRRSLSSAMSRVGYAVSGQYPQIQQSYSQYPQQPSAYQQQQSVYPQQSPQQYQQPPSKPSQLPTEVTCPTCNYQIAVNIRSLPHPITCPQCGTRGFIE